MVWQQVSAWQYQTQILVCHEWSKKFWLKTCYEEISCRTIDILVEHNVTDYMILDKQIIFVYKNWQLSFSTICIYVISTNVTFEYVTRHNFFYTKWFALFVSNKKWFCLQSVEVKWQSCDRSLRSAWVVTNRHK